jgi:exosortase B
MAALQDFGAPADTSVSRGWFLVVLGLLVLYLPTFYDLAAWLWQQEEYAHGPIILVISGWLIWRRRAVLMVFAPSGRSRAAGFALLVLGLLFYVVGRTQTVVLFEVGALAPILAGVVLAMCGWPAARALWFPILFTEFMVPLPGVFVDALTGPLKQYVSEISEQLLHAAGYPIARDGVVITIGQYQLLVADACSGLNSMFSLAALGLLFTYLMARASGLHKAITLASILPIAFAANIVRVLGLILITYHFGDAAGQGFLHGAAGIVMLMVSVTTLVFLDAALARVIKR